MVVRELAALDMYGAAGTTRRRWIVLIEFWAGTVLCTGLGSLNLASESTATRLVGVWFLGAAVNYFPLAAHATDLLRPGVLERELDGVDVPTRLRRYGVLQLWIAVPGAVAVMAVLQAFGRRTG